jgi:aryl-alcohol dehydrogenase-like predicted oxidoreductase
MAEERLMLAELLEKAGDGDFLRAVAEAVLQLLMETDVEGLIGAGRYERSGERTTWRNGYRALEELRSAGTVRAIGIGVNEREVLFEAMEWSTRDVFLRPLHPARTSAARRSAAKCQRAGTSIVVE